MQLTAGGLKCLAEPMTISGVIIIAEKTCLAIMPPLHDVQWHTGKMNARPTRHDQYGNTLIRAWPL
jgi:hypothetical protein